MIITASNKRFKKIAVSFGLVALVGALTVLTSVLISRTYGPSGLGLYATVISIGQILGTLCGTSVGTYAITKLPRLIQEHDPHAKQFAFQLCVLVLIFTITTVMILSIILSSQMESILLLAVSASIMAHAVQNFARDLLRCYGALVRSYFVLITTNLLTLVLVIAYSSILKQTVPIQYLLIPALAATVVIALSIIAKSSFFNGQEFLHYIRGLRTRTRRLNVSGAKVATSAFLPMIVASVAQVTLTKTDILIAGSFGSITLAGELTAAITVASVAIMGLAALNAIYVPKINAATKENATRVLVEVQKIGAVLTIFACIAIYTFDVHILNLFGFESPESIRALRILLVGTFINALTGPVIFVGLKISNGRPVALILVAAVILNIIGDILVFNTYGIVGLAFITALVSSATNIAVFILIVKEQP